MNQIPIWHLKKGHDRRFREGHPWVFSNELVEKPTGISPGCIVELQDTSNQFLAIGYGNPRSLIAFRELSRSPLLRDPLSVDHLSGCFDRMAVRRDQIGLSQFSHRFCFGEGDGISGLIIDRYLLSGGGQIFVLQAHTAGIDLALDNIVLALENHVARSGSIPWSETSVVIRNDLRVRELEGLKSEEPRIARSPASETTLSSISEARIQVAGALDFTPISFCVDLLNGQKTGFFFDQFGNIEQAARILKSWNFDPSSSEVLDVGPHSKGNPSQPRDRKPIKILDICCYVGQWSVQLSRILNSRRFETEVWAADISDQALSIAQKNLTPYSNDIRLQKLDALKGLGGLPSEYFDIIVCDPPAFIKNRKDIEVGKHAYLKLNTESLKLLKPGGLYITCSCSGLLEESDFLKILGKASRRAKSSLRWISRGSLSGDHPMRAEFLEGNYLKCYIGVKE